MITISNCKDDIASKKSQLRNWAKLQRKIFFTKEKNNLIVSQLKRNIIFKEAKNIAIFYPLDNEVNFSCLFNEQQNSKNYFLPVVKDNQMDFYYYEPKHKMKQGAFGINEPTSDIKANYNALDLIILPALLADKKGFRLGYGKGFYDRFLAQNNIKATKIIPILDELFINELVHDNYDKKADFVVTPTKFCICE